MNAASQPPTIYYGVHVPGWLQDLTSVAAVETNAYKPVSIVMWYQGWGLTDGSQNFEPLWMEKIRNHGSITDLLAMTSKPLMIAETASAEQGGNKASWITDAFSVQIPRTFPKIKAVIWFNENKETDWRIESSPTAQAAFAHALSSNVYASNQYATLSTSPIPPL